MATPLLTSLCAVKTFMQISDQDTSRDRVINQLIPQVSTRIQKYCGRTFGTFEYTHYFSGDGTPCLVLRERPVLRGSVRVWVDNGAFWDQGREPQTTEDGPFPPQSELKPGEFALDIDDGDTLSGSGLLYRVAQVWPFAKTRLWLNQSPDLAADHRYPTGNVKVVYMAGDLPWDVQWAANLTIAAVLQMNQTGVPIQSETYEDYSRSLASTATSGGYRSVFPPEVLEILAGYKELAW